MKINIYARPIDVDGEGFGDTRDRYLGTVVCDSVSRALQMYEDDLNPDEPEELVWSHAEEASKAAAILGRKGGKARAGRPAAVAASRENGKKGGYPKGRPRRAK